MEYLPTAEEQEWLIEGLADLLRSRGTHQFLSMPLVEPTPRFFPDPWSFSHEGLDRVVRRLMQYADLGQLEVRIGTFSQPTLATNRKGLHGDASVAGAFLGLEAGCSYFAFNETAPADAEHMAGVMAHEVAHAYRAFHGFCDTTDRDREEWLTDLTAAYLGFGVLVANNSYRYRTSGEVLAGLSYHTWSEHRVGYLSPQAFAYLLAIQMDARLLTDAERRRLLGHLEANQVAFVKAAAEAILDWPEENLARLQYPEEEGPIERVPLESILLPLPDLRPIEAEASSAPDSEEEYRVNRGRPVFRLAQSRARGAGLVGLLIGLVLGTTLASWLHQPQIGVALLLGGLALGVYKGSRKRYDICSDPECATILPIGTTTCPGCGGLVAGSIRRPSERLAAAEAFEQKQNSKRRARARKRRTPR